MKLLPQRARVVLLIFVALNTDFALAADGVKQPEPRQTGATPPWKRQLAGEDAQRVESLTKKILQLTSERKLAEAVEPAKQVLAICEKSLGGDHWRTQDALRDIETLAQIASLPEEGRTAIASVRSLENQMTTARKERRYADAEHLSEELLQISRRWLGESHPETAKGYNQLARYLGSRGKFAEAESLYRKALAIELEKLGEVHPETGTTYHNLAYNLNEQGKHTAAEPIHRKALAIQLQTLGEVHPGTAIVYNIFGRNLESQGNYAGAEPMFRRAVAIQLKVLGEDNPSTATSTYNLGLVLLKQGRYAEAEPFCRKALAVRLKQYGEGDFLTSSSYDALAESLDNQGKQAEAESLLRKALAIKRRVLGDDRSRTANEYDNLACNLTKQGKHAEADPFYRKALDIMLRAGGQDEPLTANIYDNLANHLGYLGKYAEAEPLHRRALEITLKTVGKFHVDTAARSRNLAFNLDAQGKLAEAVQNWRTASQIYEQVRRLYSSQGLERSLTADQSPLSALAVALARQGQPRDAWAAFETDLARGLLDDLSARLLRPMTPDQRRAETDLAGQLQTLDERVARLAAKAHRTQDEDKYLDALRDRQSVLRGQWVEFQNALDRQYQAYAGRPSTLKEVQIALASDTALVGWLDVRSHHWACVVRHEGDPIWVRIPGSGKDGDWTDEDKKLPKALRAALAGHDPAWEAPAEALARQRLAPLRPHLKDVRHLVVLTSPALAGVPVETLIASVPGGTPRLVVSYAPSGSMFARSSAPRSDASGPLRLLALGDPAFPRPARPGPAPTPPDHGLAIVEVVPNGTADLFGVKAGDVLVEYNGKTLNVASDLAVVPAGDKAVRVPVKLWRDGEIRSLDIAAGPLGIQSNSKLPAAQIVLAFRAAAEVLMPGVRGEGLAPLPGTRREVQAIAALFPEGQVTTLLGSQATESAVQGLARSGALKGYRFIHLATHGKANPSVALSSAVFLAAEPEGPAESADPSALETAPDGQVTAEQIVRSWDLDADLVVLSACESALGRSAGGEGYLGFVQALFVKGARSLVLSQWRVDDKATSLLMTRFYQNLLGKRPGLSKPLPKAVALLEAEDWLRNLTPDEVGSELAALDRGGVRRLTDLSGPGGRKAAPSSKLAASRPYAHPYYWAAFILIGDPN